MDRPGTIIGYRKDGRPIRLIAGGSEPLPPPQPQQVLPQQVPTPADPQQYFTAAQLEAARQQEKDKVYGRITAAEEQAKVFKDELETLKAKEAQREAEAARQQAEAEEATKKAAEEKMSAAELIASRERELLARQAKFEEEMRVKQAVLEKEQQFLQLQSYTQTRVAEEVAQDNIAPEFLDYITGNSKEEIDASITKAVEKTASIAEAKAKAGLTPQLPGVSPTGFGLTGPLEQFLGQQQQELTPEQISALSMPEYAEYRKLRGIDKAGKDRGMFG